VAVVDHGAGNTGSIIRAIELAGGKYKTVQRPNQLKEFDAIVLPGVGNFGSVIQSLKDKELLEPLRSIILENRFKVLAICVGFQILFEKSDEDISVPGLAILKGRIKRLDRLNTGGAAQKLPHVGFNTVEGMDCFTYKSSISNFDFYFCHSYGLPVTEQLDEFEIGVTDYGSKFISLIRKENLLATQFHPEKSQGNGVNLIKEFLVQ